SGAVAAYIDSLNISSSFSDIGSILMTLLSLDPGAMNCALFQLQPSMFGAYAIVEEEIMIQVRSSISRRTNELHSSGCSYPDLRGHRVSFWIDGFGGFMGQHRFHQSKFHTHNFGGSAGLDVGFGRYVYVGAMGSYNDTHIKWNDHCANGNGTDRSWYGGIYATWFNKYAFVDVSGVGAKNRYKGARKIQFGNVDRTARHHHHGHEASANLSAGGNIHVVKQFMIQPFARGDYIFLHQDHFEENNAGSLDLFVSSKNDKMIRSEGGLNFCYCQDFGKTDLAITPTISYVRESRFENRKYKAAFKKFLSTNGTFTVETGKPDRHIVAPGLTVSSQSFDNRFAFSLNYSGEFGRHFSENEVSARLDARF
ncbi:MAG TPA: autotransporter outer membrane beta-barrel domain-containing protein, partial [Rhabdochlamydiaceae bacterium]|nr:autotransporter outer membrane beta-barrel domain-containing protein [Rhabdochlamydiaceae bacterium]